MGTEVLFFILLTMLFLENLAFYPHATFAIVSPDTEASDPDVTHGEICDNSTDDDGDQLIDAYDTQDC
jgi:hypothetical protein